MATYTFPCILLSGMPGTGKDTVSHGLIERDSAFAFFRKHRADLSTPKYQSNNAYIHVSSEEFWRIANTDGFMQFHQRYEKMYGVSKEEYLALTNGHKIPIIHVGKYENLKKLRKGGLQEGLSILLWADRDIVRSRLIERHKHRSDGIEERLTAYDQEVEQLKRCDLVEELDFDVIFVNNGPDPEIVVNNMLTVLHAHNSQTKSQTRTQLSQILKR